MPPFRKICDDGGLVLSVSTPSFSSSSSSSLIVPSKQQQKTKTSKNKSVFESLPHVQAWLARCDSGPDGLVFLQLMRDDPLWLDGVLEELIRVVPVGSMTKSIFGLSRRVLRSLSSHGSHQAGHMAVTLFRRLLREEDCGPHRIDAPMYSMVLRTSHTTIPILKLMDQRHQHNPRCTRRRLSNRVAAICTLVRHGKPDQAESLLWDQAPVALCNSILHAHPHPSERLLLRLDQHPLAVEIVLRKHKGDPDRAQALLERVRQPTTRLYKTFLRECRCDAKRVKVWMERLLVEKHWPLLLWGWTFCGEAAKAETVLLQVKQTIQPRFWRLAVRCWLSNGNIDRAQRLVQRAPPDVGMCNQVLLALSHDNVEKAQAFFEWMAQEPGLLLNRSTYRILLGAWHKSGSRRAGLFVQHLMERMMDQDGVQPTRRMLHTAFGALQMCNHKNQVLQLWRRLDAKQKDSLSSRCYTMILACSPAMDIAKDIFMRMAKANIRPTVASLECVVLAGTAGLASLPKSLVEQPDSVACNAVLAISLTRNTPEALRISKSMVSRMLMEYRNGNTDMLPQPLAFTRLFSNLYRERERIPARAAYNLVLGVRDWSPDGIFGRACLRYALTICAWSHDKETPHCALKLWQAMRARADVDCLNLLLRTLGNHPRRFSHHAEDALAQCQPNDESYLLVLECIAKSREPGSAQRALLFRERHHQWFSSSLASFSLVLMACVHAPATRHSTKQFHHYLALRCCARMRQLGQTPSATDYYRLVMSCSRAAPDGPSRLAMSKAVFAQCCRHGRADARIQRLMRSLVPPQVHFPSLDASPSLTTTHTQQKENKGQGVVDDVFIVRLLDL